MYLIFIYLWDILSEFLLFSFYEVFKLIFIISSDRYQYYINIDIYINQYQINWWVSL